MADYLVSEGGSIAQFSTTIVDYECYCLQYQILVKNMENYPGLTGQHLYCLSPNANKS